MNLHVDDLNLLAAHGLTEPDLEHSTPTPTHDVSDNIDGEFRFCFYSNFHTLKL